MKYTAIIRNVETNEIVFQSTKYRPFSERKYALKHAREIMSGSEYSCPGLYSAGAKATDSPKERAK